MNSLDPHQDALWLEITPFELELKLHEVNSEVDNNVAVIEKEFAELPENLESSKLTLHNQKTDRYPGINYLVENHCLRINHDKHVHASMISLPRISYIATQSPLSQTINDFWQMVAEQQSPVIINLVHKYEMLLPNQTSKDTVEKYWPAAKTTTQLTNGLQVANLGETTNGPITERRFRLIQPSGKKHDLVQIHYTTWEDGSKLELLQLIELIRRVYCLIKADPKHPVIVHCRAGVGRTGTFIAAHYLLMHAKQQMSTRDLVSSIRQYRRGMVASFEQYQMVYAMEQLYLLMAKNRC